MRTQGTSSPATDRNWWSRTRRAVADAGYRLLFRLIACPTFSAEGRRRMRGSGS